MRNKDHVALSNIVGLVVESTVGSDQFINNLIGVADVYDDGTLLAYLDTVPDRDLYAFMNRFDNGSLHDDTIMRLLGIIPLAIGSEDNSDEVDPDNILPDDVMPAGGLDDYGYDDDYRREMRDDLNHAYDHFGDHIDKQGFSADERQTSVRTGRLPAKKTARPRR